MIGYLKGKILSKTTNYVVVGENPGSKATKAEQLGVEILGEDEFLELIKYEKH